MRKFKYIVIFDYAQIITLFKIYTSIYSVSLKNNRKKAYHKRDKLLFCVYYYLY